MVSGERGRGGELGRGGGKWEVRSVNGVALDLDC